MIELGFIHLFLHDLRGTPVGQSPFKSFPKFMLHIYKIAIFQLNEQHYKHIALIIEIYFFRAENHQKNKK